MGTVTWLGCPVANETPEELAEMKEARERLTAAIENYLRVYEWDGSAPGDGDPRVLTDYVVFTATQGWTKDGDTVTGHPYIFREGMPMYRALGLVQMSVDIMGTTIDENWGSSND